MKRTILLFSFTLSILCSTARTPAGMAYSFPAPELEKLVPFSKDQSDSIRTHGVYKCETTDKEYKTIYYFNRLGQAIREETIRANSKKPLLILTTRYRYDKQGNMILRTSSGLEPGNYDSLVYNKDNRLIAYYSSWSTAGGKKKPDQIFTYRMSLVSIDDTKTVLVYTDSTWEAFYTLNNKNEFIKVVYPDQTDSMAVIRISDNEYKKVFLYFSSGDTLFKTGMEEVYKDGKIKKQIIYDVSNPGAIRTIYNHSYNDKGQLICVTGTDEYHTKIFYTYTNLGLLYEELILEPGYKKRLNLISHQYSFSGLFSGLGTFPNKTLKDSISIGDVVKIPELGYDPGGNPNKDSLDLIADFILKHSLFMFEFGSHTDARGSAEVNKKLSLMKAKYCTDYLINEKKIDPSRLRPEGYGESLPIILQDEIDDPTLSIEEKERFHKINRRTELKVVGKKGK